MLNTEWEFPWKLLKIFWWWKSNPLTDFLSKIYTQKESLLTHVCSQTHVKLHPIWFWIDLMNYAFDGWQRSLVLIKQMDLMLERLRYYHKGSKTAKVDHMGKKGKQDGFKEIEYSLTLSFHREKTRKKRIWYIECRIRRSSITLIYLLSMRSLHDTFAM